MPENDGVTAEEIEEYRTVKPQIYTLAVILVISFLVYIGMGIKHRKDINLFDRSFESGQIKFNTTYIAFGASGHPGESSITADIPEGSYQIRQWPRVFTVTGRQVLSLPEGAVGIHAATDADPSLLNVEIPPQEGGGVVVTAPENVTIRLILWVEMKK